MPTSVLFKRSRIFTDAFNIVFHIDLFLYHELKYRIDHEDELLSYLTEGRLPMISAGTDRGSKDAILVGITSSKRNQNILLDWIDKGKYELLDLGPDKMPYQMFIGSLYYHMLTKPMCDEYLQMSQFGNTLKILTTDPNLNKLIIYCPFQSEFVTRNIIESFAGNGLNKIDIVCGSYKDHLKDLYFDSYSFENAMDVDQYILKKHPSPCEVIIPAYEYNLVEGRSRTEELLEQVTYTRLNLKETPSEYREKYNLVINNLGVPL